MQQAPKIGPLLGLATLTVNVGLWAALSLAARPAAAQTTVYSTFGPGDTFLMAGPVVGGPGAGGAYESVGVVFTPSASGALYSITVAVGNAGGPDDAHFYLTDSFADLGNTAASLESFTFTGVPSYSSNVAPLVGISSAHPTLTAGDTYYLYELEPGTTADVWEIGPSATGLEVLSLRGGAYSSINGVSLPAFSVQVGGPPAVPEPSQTASLGLGALGVLGLLARARRRRTAA